MNTPLHYFLSGTATGLLIGGLIGYILGVIKSDAMAHKSIEPLSELDRIRRKGL